MDQANDNSFVYKRMDYILEDENINGTRAHRCKVVDSAIEIPLSHVIIYTYERIYEQRFGERERYEGGRKSISSVQL